MAKKAAAKKPAKRPAKKAAKRKPRATLTMEDAHRAGLKQGREMTSDTVARLCQAFNLAAERIQQGMCDRGSLTRVDEATNRRIDLLAIELDKLAQAVKKLAGVVMAQDDPIGGSMAIQEAMRPAARDPAQSLAEIRRFVSQELDRLGA